MRRSIAKDGSTILDGGFVPTRVGTTTAWHFADSTDVPCTFADGKPPRVGDILVSVNGFSSGQIYTISKVYASGNVDILNTSGNLNFQMHLDTGWIAPTMQNSWVHYATGYAIPAYRRINGITYLKGLVKSGTMGAAIFTLPAGFRPDPAGGEIQTFVGDAGGTVSGAASTGTAHTHTTVNQGARVDIYASTGVVRAESPATNGFISITGICFPADT